MDSGNLKARILNLCLKTYNINEKNNLQINKSYKIRIKIRLKTEKVPLFQAGKRNQEKTRTQIV